MKYLQYPWHKWLNTTESFLDICYTVFILLSISEVQKYNLSNPGTMKFYYKHHLLYWYLYKYCCVSVHAMVQILALLKYELPNVVQSEHQTTEKHKSFPPFIHSFTCDDDDDNRKQQHLIN